MIILYAEDCEVAVELLLYQLGHFSGSNDISIDVAETVADAMQLFSVERHGAALIDWNLPDGKGIDIARHIRSETETLPIIFLSAVITDEHLSIAEVFNPKACMKKGHGKSYVETLLQLISVDQDSTLPTRDGSAT